MTIVKTTIRPRRHRGGGFTLPELIAVLVVAAIVAAAAIPSLAGAGVGARASHAARLLLGDITSAREHAVATAVPVWVVFDPAAESCVVLAENPASPGRAGAAPITDAATGRVLMRTFGAGEFVGVGIESADFGGGAELGFDWLGRPTATGGSPLAAPGLVVLTGNHRLTVEPGGGIPSYTAP